MTRGIDEADIIQLGTTTHFIPSKGHAWQTKS